MKVSSAVKAASAATAGSSAVATPTTFAVINHNKNISITKALTESQKKNEELTDQNTQISYERTQLQSLGAKESYEFKQKILELQKQLDEVTEQLQAQELHKQTLQKKITEMDQYNVSLKECGNLMAGLHLYGQNSQYSSQISWCSQQLQNSDLNQYLQQIQSGQFYSQTLY